MQLSLQWPDAGHLFSRRPVADAGDGKIPLHGALCYIQSLQELLINRKQRQIRGSNDATRRESTTLRRRQVCCEHTHAHAHTCTTEMSERPGGRPGWHSKSQAERAHSSFMFSRRATAASFTNAALKSNVGKAEWKRRRWCRRG